MHYQVHLLKDRKRPDSIELLAYFNGSLRERLIDQGVTLYGTFASLFGLASNEIYLVTSSEQAPVDLTQVLSGFDVIDRIDLIPTARPTDHSPRTIKGVYVFRWFNVMNKDINEIVELSEKAWVTFEGGFDTEVQCLFAEESPESDQSKMLLITWYRDLAVWQDSRRPPEEARDNFLRRHQLTLEAKPIATRLVTN